MRTSAPGQQRARCHLLPLTAGQQGSARALFGTETAEDVVVKRVAMVHDPLARVVSGLHDHVHSVSIAGEVAEVDNHFASDSVTLDPVQLAMACSRLGLSTNCLEFVRKSDGEVVRSIDILEEKYR